MTLDDLIALFRINTDDGADPPLWSDETVTGYLNEAVTEACLRSRLLMESQYDPMCRLEYEAGDRLVKLHPKTLIVRTAKIDGQNSTLERIATKRLLRIRESWDVDTNTGTPKYLVMDYQDGNVAFSPLPDEDGTLVIAAWRAPLDNELLRESNPDGEPVIVDNGGHRHLVDWAEHLAYNVKDAETHDPARAAVADAKFTAYFGERPSAHEIKLWATAAIRGSIPRFI
jgi:hypothetical protein